MPREDHDADTTAPELTDHLEARRRLGCTSRWHIPPANGGRKAYPLADRQVTGRRDTSAPRAEPLPVAVREVARRDIAAGNLLTMSAEAPASDPFRVAGIELRSSQSLQAVWRGVQGSM